MKLVIEHAVLCDTGCCPFAEAGTDDPEVTEPDISGSGKETGMCTKYSFLP
ncbi:hypothetical protein [Paracoccus sp. (in: a-proteobacteria)]|uniref:hypothetical protein n=1 Tax=Paracoccus sp. TaxID=267 RepID=UPI00272D4450|nr:hypothetical protein [Paracoccus sp. (in: a-proteobacteria)]